MALNQLPWVEKPTTLPPVHRYITSHRPDGTSTVLSSPDQLYRGAPGVLGVSRSYAVESVPAKLDASQDVEKYMSEDTESNPTSRRLLDIVASNQRGVVMTVVDFGPGQSSSMHQTVSIDFSICVIGAIDCELDSGEIVHLNAGDHIIQRGTMHKWINTSETQPARLIVCVVPAESFDIGGGKMLEEEHLPSDPKPSPDTAS